jgi:hypothetical protein
VTDRRSHVVSSIEPADAGREAAPIALLGLGTGSVALAVALVEPLIGRMLGGGWHCRKARGGQPDSCPAWSSRAAVYSGSPKRLRLRRTRAVTREALRDPAPAYCAMQGQHLHYANRFGIRRIRQGPRCRHRARALTAEFSPESQRRSNRE